MSWLIPKNFCNSLNQNAKKAYFKRAAENGIMCSGVQPNLFWLGSTTKVWGGRLWLLHFLLCQDIHNIVSSGVLLTLKDSIHKENISIEINDKIIEDESELAKQFNPLYINIVKTTMGKHATKIGTLISKITKIILVELSLKSAKIIWVSKLSKRISANWKSNYWG